MKDDHEFFDLKDNIAILITKAEKRLKYFQKRCKHKQISEYYDLKSHYPPKRICINCGIQEQGWGSGYKILGDSKDRQVTDVSHDEYLTVIKRYSLSFFSKGKQFSNEESR